MGRAMDKDEKQFDTLGELLEALEETAKDKQAISIAGVQELVGHRAFGPLILLPGLLAVTPLSGIPTVPSIIGVIVSLISIQLLIGRRHLWLPERLRTAELSADRLEKAMRFTRPVARAVDKVIHRRLPALTGNLALRISALVCLVVAVTMPPLEVLPFVATAAGVVLSLFGLALTVHDGLLLIVAYVLTVAFAGLALSLL